MNRFEVIYTRESRQDLIAIRDYIALQTSRKVANNYLKRLRLFCDTLSFSPHRGEQRQGLKLGQRTIGFEGRISIIFQISEESGKVRVVGFRYAGKKLTV